MCYVCGFGCVVNEECQVCGALFGRRELEERRNEVFECVHPKTETFVNEEGTCEWDECVCCGAVTWSRKIEPGWDEFMEQRRIEKEMEEEEEWMANQMDC